MASKVVDSEWRGGVYVVVVEHTVTDSFARSVDRAAMGAWKALPLCDRMRLRFKACDYGRRTEGRRCWSRVAFAAEFPQAYVALGLEPPPE